MQNLKIFGIKTSHNFLSCCLSLSYCVKTLIKVRRLFKVNCLLPWEGGMAREVKIN